MEKMLKLVNVELILIMRLWMACEFVFVNYAFYISFVILYYHESKLEVKKNPT